MKRKKSAKPSTKKTARATKPDVIAELQKVSEERLRQVSGGHQAEFLCILGGCY